MVGIQGDARLNLRSSAGAGPSASAPVCPVRGGADTALWFRALSFALGDVSRSCRASTSNKVRSMGTSNVKDA